MGKHSIRFKITVLFAGIICILIVMLLLFNITFSEKFYMQDKQEAMLNAYESIDDACNQYSSGSISDTDLRNNLEQVSTSKGMSIIIVNSDWTTFYVSTHGDEMMLERLKKSIFNNDIFQGMPDKSGSMQEQPDENRNGDINAGKKTLPEKIIDMSGNGASETRDILYQSDKYTVQKVYDSRLLDDYIELWGTLDNGNFILIRTPIQGIKDNVHISNTFITYIGIGTLIIGIIAAFVLSSYISRPIKQLSNIAERMSELDFDIKYDGKDKGEIGLLGKSMNNMSQKLEENISQLKAANLELQRDIDKKEKLEKMRTDFLSNVSHELKTPIALIQGYAEGLKEGITDDPESMDFYCSVIMDEAAKMNNMVKRLLTLNQIEFGEDELVMERFDINELVKSVVNANELRATQKNLSITYDILDTPLYVWADEYKVEEVVTNYLSNAINHCCNENIIKIKVGHIDKDNVRVSVFNTGNNIPEADIEHIWEKFYKVDKARTREYGGNGIGLSIVKAIVESMGKTCGVNNLSDGVEFWFDLDCKL
ncbi:MAG: HAMP domain-containing sensor histidine kinase [Lachnospira sp.]|nr:HAMP domain-containing sensor histidine kinase [Lachnospira sp.]